MSKARIHDSLASTSHSRKQDMRQEGEFSGPHWKTRALPGRIQPLTGDEQTASPQANCRWQWPLSPIPPTRKRWWTASSLKSGQILIYLVSKKSQFFLCNPRIFDLKIFFGGEHFWDRVSLRSTGCPQNWLTSTQILLVSLSWELRLKVCTTTAQSIRKNIFKGMF